MLYICVLGLIKGQSKQLVLLHLQTVSTTRRSMHRDISADQDVYVGLFTSPVGWLSSLAFGLPSEPRPHSYAVSIAVWILGWTWLGRISEPAVTSNNTWGVLGCCRHRTFRCGYKIRIWQCGSSDPSGKRGRRIGRQR